MQFILKDITLIELSICLAKVKGSTPGFDSVIQNDKNLSSNVQNNIFKTGVIPTDWKDLTLIPISKTSKKSLEIKLYCPISYHALEKSLRI